jgi:uncharacterized protein YkwD
MSWLSDWLRAILDRLKPTPTPPEPVDPPIPRPAPPGPPGILPPIVPSDRAVALFSAINAARAAHGVGSLMADGRLNRVAQAHAGEDADAHQLTHSWKDNRSLGDHVRDQGYDFRTIGECLDWWRATPEGAVAAWIGDAPHARILLDSTYRDLGVGHAVASDGLPFWCAVFATPT